MPKSNKPVYTENDRAIVNALKGTDGMTLAEINATGLEIKSGHIVSAMKKGLIASIGEREVTRPSTRKVSTYNFVTADAQVRENGKPFDYTEGESKVLAAAANIDSPFTLADLAKAMGVEKLSSGSINSLVRKGNITKGDQVEVPAIAKSTVKVYGFVADIPADAEQSIDFNTKVWGEPKISPKNN